MALRNKNSTPVSGRNSTKVQGAHPKQPQLMEENTLPLLIPGLDNSDADALRKQIEAGNITYNDLQKANRLGELQSIPRNGAIVGGAAGGAYAGYRLFIRPTTPPFSVGRIVGIILAGSFAGGMYGNIQAARRFKQIVSEMDDPKRFNQGLKEIVKEKLAKIQSSPKPSLPHKAQTRSQSVQEPQDNVRDGWSEGNPSQSPPDTASTKNGQDIVTDNTQSRWEAIRAEKSTAKPTSWDVLRQSYEREKLLKTSGQPDGSQPLDAKSTIEGNNGSSRDDEQAKFDALLEADRQASGDSPDAYGANFGDRVDGTSPAGRPGGRWRRSP